MDISPGSLIGYIERLYAAPFGNLDELGWNICIVLAALFCCSRGEGLVRQKSVEPGKFGELGEDGDVTALNMYLQNKLVNLKESPLIKLKDLISFDNKVTTLNKNK